MAKKFKSKITGAIIVGTLKESTKFHKGIGYDWSFLYEGENGRRALFTSLEEFVSKYQEFPNEEYHKFLKRYHKKLKKINK